MRFAHHYAIETMLYECRRDIVFNKSPRNFLRLLREGLGDVIRVVSSKDEPFYTYQEVEVDCGADSPITMKRAVTKSGAYIGDPQMVKRLTEKYGIESFELAAPDHRVCSIGFSPKQNKWYGWSHRAIYGFGVGSEVKKDNCAFLPANKEQFIENVIEWHRSLGRVNTRVDKEAINHKQSGVWVKWDTKKPSDISGEFEAYPDTWGKGEWKANTMEDAKQMAIDFARSVA